MMTWLAANAATIIITFIILGLVFLAGRSVYRSKGSCCSGGCSGCAGSCGGCSGCAGSCGGCSRGSVVEAPKMKQMKHEN